MNDQETALPRRRASGIIALLLLPTLASLLPVAEAAPATFFYDGFESGSLSSARWQNVDWPAMVAAGCPSRPFGPSSTLGAPFPPVGLYALYKEDTGWANPDRLLRTVPISIPPGASVSATLSFWYGVCSDDMGELTIRASHSDGRYETLPFARFVQSPTFVSVPVTLVPGGWVQFELWSNSGLMLDEFALTGLVPQCSDGIDNDGDGRTDYPNDLGCSDPSDDDEADQFIACIYPISFCI